MFDKTYPAKPKQENVCGEVRFNKIAGRVSRHATLLKRTFHSGSFPVNT